MPRNSDIWIVGAAEAPLGAVTDQSELSMVALAASEALDEAGLTLGDVDGLFVNYMGDVGTIQVGEYLGVAPRYVDSTDIGGCAFEAFVHHALLALEAGRCDVALIAYASRQRTRRKRSNDMADIVGRDTLMGQFEVPYALPAAIGYNALAAARYLHEYDATVEDLAEVALTARSWAQLNPKAWRRDPLTMEEALASPVLSSPLRKVDCCLVTDGGGAVVLTRGDRAKDAAKSPVRVLGAGESHDHWNVTQSTDLTRSSGRASAREAFAMAGVTPADVDVFEPYDAFTISVLIALEDVGFCAPGEAAAFVRNGELRAVGALPSMTSGGGLSYCHPGALGLLLLVETVRQLRHEAGARQVPGAEIGVAHGIGGLMSAASTVVLSRG